MKLTRRSFIKIFPIGAAISVLSWWLLKRETPTSPARYLETAGPSQTTSEATGETSDFPATWNGDWPVDIDPENYRLSVDGDVSNPFELRLDELYAMPAITENQTISCVTGWSALVRWEGISLSSLLGKAGAPSEFDHVIVESITGYAMTLSRKDVAASGAMIALKAGSAPLKVEHGYPARLVLPGRPGYEWVKYATRITCKREMGSPPRN
jgi:DMSO/TMAO reductase YedYZ molybdopterin-dependent catalytic subunit